MQLFAIMCKQTVTMHVVYIIVTVCLHIIVNSCIIVKQLKPQQLKGLMYNCGNIYGIASYSYVAIHLMTNRLAGYMSQG